MPDDQDKWSQYEVAAPAGGAPQQDKWAQYESTPQVAPAPQAAAPPKYDAGLPDVMSAQGAGELAKGAVKGALKTATGAANATFGRLASPERRQQMEQAATKMTTPANTNQQWGQGLEQLGEFMVPGAGEGEALAKVPRIGRMALNAGQAALLNKAQGGSWKAGLAGGVGGEALGALGRTVAPAMAESSLGISSKMRGHGRTIGPAVLKETTAMRPARLEGQLQDKIGELTDQMESGVHQATARGQITSTSGAHRVLDDAIKGAPRNATDYKQALGKLKDILHLGHPGQIIYSPDELLEMKRGIGIETNFTNREMSPEASQKLLDVRHKLYGQLDHQLDKASPGNHELNQRISSLIPATRRARAVQLNAGLTQNVMHRTAAHTGALAAPLAGALGGYGAHGLAGGAAGGVVGLVLPELISRPGTRMGMARAANSPLVPRIARVPLQLNRPERKESENK